MRQNLVRHLDGIDQDPETHGLAGQGRFLVFADIDTCRDQDGRRGRAGMTATFAALSADNVDTLVESLLDVLGVSDHLSQRVSPESPHV